MEGGVSAWGAWSPEVGGGWMFLGTGCEGVRADVHSEKGAESQLGADGLWWLLGGCKRVTLQLQPTSGPSINSRYWPPVK